MACLACGAASQPDAPVTPPASVAAPSLYPVQIRHPATLGMVDTEQTTPAGTPAGIACATCHDAGLRASLVARSGASSFHAGVALRHGGLSCDACHAPEDRTRLHLADGERIAFGDVMRLCGQCHGPQLRDYEHGAHGGMRGYWDLSRGPRERNSCIVCHGAHEPVYPLVIPAPPPRDRFLGVREPVAQGGGDEH